MQLHIRRRTLLLLGLFILASAPVIYPTSVTASDPVLTIRPNSSGSFTQWTPYPSGLSNWDCVDEEPQNGDTDYVYATATALADSYGLQDTALTGYSISNVRIGTYAKQTTGNEKLKQMLVIGGVSYYGAVDHQPATTYSLYTNDWAINPATGLSWTWSDINLLEAGFESRVAGGWKGEIRVTQLYVEVTYIAVIHDVATVSATTAATEAYPTWRDPFGINVTVMNEGTEVETFNVTVYAYNATYDITYQIGTQTVTDLAPGANTTLPSFSWVLTDVTHHVIYTITANASVVSGETDTADNTLIDGTVFIKLPGDVNGDGTVNVSDLGRLGLAWGSSVGDPNYDPRCDFNGDGVINVSDLGIMGLWWGYAA